MNCVSLAHLKKVAVLAFGLAVIVLAVPGCALNSAAGSNESFADYKPDDRNLDLSQEDAAKAYQDAAKRESKFEPSGAPQPGP